MDNNTTVNPISGDNIRISSDVIEIIAGLAINDIKDIDKQASKSTKGRKNKPIEVVTFEDGTVLLTVNISVNYGTKIPELGREIQQKVKDAVQNMTGLTVKAVNINVIGMNIEKSAKKA